MFLKIKVLFFFFSISYIRQISGTFINECGHPYLNANEQSDLYSLLPTAGQDIANIYAGDLNVAVKMFDINREELIYNQRSDCSAVYSYQAEIKELKDGLSKIITGNCSLQQVISSSFDLSLPFIPNLTFLIDQIISKQTNLNSIDLELNTIINNNGSFSNMNLPSIECLSIPQQEIYLEFITYLQKNVECYKNLNEKQIVQQYLLGKLVTFQVKNNLTYNFAEEIQETLSINASSFFDIIFVAPIYNSLKISDFVCSTYLLTAPIQFERNPIQYFKVPNDSKYKDLSIKGKLTSKNLMILIDLYIEMMSNARKEAILNNSGYQFNEELYRQINYELEQLSMRKFSIQIALLKLGEILIEYDSYIFNEFLPRVMPYVYENPDVNITALLFTDPVYVQYVNIQEDIVFYLPEHLKIVYSNFASFLIKSEQEDLFSGAYSLTNDQLLKNKVLNQMIIPPSLDSMNNPSNYDFKTSVGSPPANYYLQTAYQLVDHVFVDPIIYARDIFKNYKNELGYLTCLLSNN